jgi:hypothetical protein
MARAKNKIAIGGEHLSTRIVQIKAFQLFHCFKTIKTNERIDRLSIQNEEETKLCNFFL